MHFFLLYRISYILYYVNVSLIYLQSSSIIYKLHQVIISRLFFFASVIIRFTLMNFFLLLSSVISEIIFTMDRLNKCLNSCEHMVFIEVTNHTYKRNFSVSVLLSSFSLSSVWRVIFIFHFWKKRQKNLHWHFLVQKNSVERFEICTQIHKYDAADSLINRIQFLAVNRWNSIITLIDCFNSYP